MIAIGGSIGTGLFVGSAGSFTAGGPASVIICFMLIGIMLFTVVHALGELAVMFPIQGSFSVFSTRFIDPAWGFAMGWKYVADVSAFHSQLTRIAMPCSGSLSCLSNSLLQPSSSTTGRRV